MGEYKFGLIWRLENYVRILIFGWTTPMKWKEVCVTHPEIRALRARTLVIHIHAHILHVRVFFLTSSSLLDISVITRIIALLRNSSPRKNNNIADILCPHAIHAIVDEFVSSSEPIWSILVIWFESGENMHRSSNHVLLFCPEGMV